MEDKLTQQLDPAPSGAGKRPFGVGRVGRAFSLAALAAFGLLFLFRPG